LGEETLGKWVVSVSSRRILAKGFADEAIHRANPIRVENFGNGLQAILGLSCDVL
jgi:hypothetical protein